MFAFYRGEMGRSWFSAALDVITNWAITVPPPSSPSFISPSRRPHIHFLFQPAIVGCFFGLSSALSFLRCFPRARPDARSCIFLCLLVMENREMLSANGKTRLRRFILPVLSKISNCSGWTPIETSNLCFSFSFYPVPGLTKVFFAATNRLTNVVSFYHALRIFHIPSWLGRCFLLALLECDFPQRFNVSRNLPANSEFGTPVRSGGF